MNNTKKINYSYNGIGIEIIDQTILSAIEKSNIGKKGEIYTELLDFYIEKDFFKNGNLESIKYTDNFIITFLEKEIINNGYNDNIINRIYTQTQKLIKNFDIYFSKELVKILTENFDSTKPNGSGKISTIYSSLLFAKNHKGRFNNNYFSNIIEESVDYYNTYDGKLKLENALNKLDSILCDNKIYIKNLNCKPYKLFCSKEREEYWIKVKNIFDTKYKIGKKYLKKEIEVIAIDLLEDLDNKGKKIGNKNMWFVSNPNTIRKMKALKYSITDVKFQLSINNETDNINVLITCLIKPIISLNTNF